MKRPALTAARLRELLHYFPETGVFTWKISRGLAVVGAEAGTKVSNGYIHICIDRHVIGAHRLAWLYVHGKWPKSNIDHINRNKVDNRIANLREATTSENGQNTLVNKRNTSGYKGVSWLSCRNRWRALITVNGKKHNLGLFKDPKDAYAAYCAAAQRLHKYNPAATVIQFPAPAQAAQAGG